MGTNIDTLRGVYEDFGTGNVPGVLGAMDDKIDWQEPSSLPFGSQIGPQAVAENIFGPVVTQIEGFTVVPDEMLEAGDTICVLGTYKGKGAKNGVQLDAAFAHIWRFGTDGKITGFRTHTDTHLWREVLGTN